MSLFLVYCYLYYYIMDFSYWLYLVSSVICWDSYCVYNWCLCITYLFCYYRFEIVLINYYWCIFDIDSYYLVDWHYNYIYWYDYFIVLTFDLNYYSCCYLFYSIVCICYILYSFKDNYCIYYYCCILIVFIYYYCCILKLFIYYFVVVSSYCSIVIYYL